LVSGDVLTATRAAVDLATELKQEAENAGEQLRLPPLAERTFLVTGSTAGIGRFTAELLAKEGCMVLVHGKDHRKVFSTMQKIQRKHRTARLDGFEADLSMMKEVRELADMVSSRHPVIHGILHNAATIDGDFKGRKKVTREQNEKTLAVNTFAPFLLTSLLLDNVRASGAGRIIFSSSATMGGGEFLDDLLCEREWSGNHAYALSKLCDSMLAAELHERFGHAPKLCFHSIDPGLADTKIMRQGASWGKGRRGGRRWRMPVRGMLPSVRTATASFEALTKDAFQEVSGNQVRDTPEEVRDVSKRAQLWEDLVELTGAEWPVPVSASA